LEVASKAVERRALGTRHPRRRHQPRSHLANHFLEDLGMLCRLYDVESGETQIARQRSRVVAGHAVPVDERLVGCNVRLQPDLRPLVSRTVRLQPDLCVRCACRDHNEQETADEKQSVHRVPPAAPRSRAYFSISAIVDGFSSGGWSAMNSPLAQRSGVRPCASCTSSRPPALMSTSRMSSHPWLAAPITAVNPVSFVAFTSRPSSRHSFTAAIDDSLDSTYDCCTATFPPAAVTNAVVPPSVVIFGSAPFARSRRMVVISPDIDARMKGVCPIMLIHVRSPSDVTQRRIGGISFVRAFGLAPRSSSSVTMSRAAARSIPCSLPLV